MSIFIYLSQNYLIAIGVFWWCMINFHTLILFCVQWTINILCGILNFGIWYGCDAVPFNLYFGYLDMHLLVNLLILLLIDMYILLIYIIWIIFACWLFLISFILHYLCIVLYNEITTDLLQQQWYQHYY